MQLAEPGTVIYDQLVAEDLDSGNNGLVEYFTKPRDGSAVSTNVVHVDVVVLYSNTVSIAITE